MLLLKSPDGVDAISLHHPFLIQCPKTNVVHTMKKKTHYNKAYYVTVQSLCRFGGNQYITDDTILGSSADERYYFTEEKLKELVRSQRFTIAGCI